VTLLLYTALYSYYPCYYFYYCNTILHIIKDIACARDKLWFVPLAASRKLYSHYYHNEYYPYGDEGYLNADHGKYTH
jgi:hypothetical protein